MHRDTAEYHWKPFLVKLLSTQISSDGNPVPADDECLSQIRGASAEEIQRLEHRLEKTLPPSYAKFLKVSNGWCSVNFFIYDLFPPEKVNYFAKNHQSWIDAYTCHPATVSIEEHTSELNLPRAEQNTCIFRQEFMPGLVQISDVGDDAVYLLNPNLIMENGEWEAWFFANWLPGARRYRSFWELMQAEYENYLDLLSKRNDNSWIE